jgi:hypothetical protein
MVPERVWADFADKADDQRLFVLAGPQQPAAPATLDLALTYGLA